METAEDILKRMRLNNARRAREFYHKNKDKIIEKRKEKRRKIRELKKEAKNNAVNSFIVNDEGKIIELLKN